MRKKKWAVPDKAVCVSCGACRKVCPREAISIWKGCYAVVDGEKCVGCGICKTRQRVDHDNILGVVIAGDTFFENRVQTV